MPHFEADPWTVVGGDIKVAWGTAQVRFVCRRYCLIDLYQALLLDPEVVYLRAVVAWWLKVVLSEI